MSLFDIIKNAVTGNANTAINRAANTAINNAANNATNAVRNAASNTSRSISLPSLPKNVGELRAMPGADLKDPYTVLALFIAALAEYPNNKQATIEMINFLKGPEPIANRDIQLFDDHMSKPYIVRSYFVGARPENDYTATQPYTVVVSENPYSRDQFEQGYLTLYVQSGGADSPRPVQLRTKKSTGEWFIWTQNSVIMDIRIPVSQDKWA